MIRRSWQVAAIMLFAGLTSTSLLASGSVEQGSPEKDDATKRDDVAGSLLLVLGAPGNDEYEHAFLEWSKRWEAAAARGGLMVNVLGRGDTEQTDRERTDREVLREAIEAAIAPTDRPLWIVMIGHGTFDGRAAKFNLRGTDVTAREMSEWLSENKRPLAVINCSSASAPFVDRLSGPNRIVLTATKSGGEVNYARFGDHLSQTIAAPAADLDKDGQVSLLEAFLMASRRTQSYYKGQRQLATEHAILDDNGDGRGVREDFFFGVRPVKKADGGESLDGTLSHQWHLVPSDEERRLSPEMRRQRDQLEVKLAALRNQKVDLPEEDYFRQLEPLLVDIALLYESADKTAN